MPPRWSCQATIAPPAPSVTINGLDAPPAVNSATFPLFGSCGHAARAAAGATHGSRVATSATNRILVVIMAALLLNRGEAAAEVAAIRLEPTEVDPARDRAARIIAPVPASHVITRRQRLVHQVTYAPPPLVEERQRYP